MSMATDYMKPQRHIVTKTKATAIIVIIQISMKYYGDNFVRDFLFLFRSNYKVFLNGSTYCTVSRR